MGAAGRLPTIDGGAFAGATPPLPTVLTPPSRMPTLPSMALRDRRAPVVADALGRRPPHHRTERPFLATAHRLNGTAAAAAFSTAPYKPR